MNSYLKLLPDIWKNKSQIAEGIKNRVFKKEHIEELAKARLDICKSCIWYSENYRKGEEIPEVIIKKKGESIKESIKDRIDGHCISCGCNMGTKTRCLTCQCPIFKWMPVANQNEKEEIEKIINES